MKSLTDEYDLLDLIGQGANATIYKARHKKLGYVRVIKIAKERVANEQSHAYQTFLNECRVLLGLGNGCHPNIVRIYQPRLIEGQALVEMDYVEGQTLTEYLASVRLMGMDEVFRFAREIIGALAYCHVDIYKFMMDPAQDNLPTSPDDGRRLLVTPEKRLELIQKYGIIHNDLHSGNIMRRDYDGVFVLLDFGLAIQNNKAVKSSSRRDGAVEYMAPEKWKDGAEVTRRTDVYSLGVLLYEALTGRVPFPIDGGDGNFEYLNRLYHAHSEQEPPSMEQLRREAFETLHPGETYHRDFPQWFEDLILKCLAKNPEERYADGRAVLEDFEAHIRPMLAGDKGLRDEIRRLQTESDSITKDLKATQQLAHDQQIRAEEAEDQRDMLIGYPRSMRSLMLMLLAAFGIAVAFSVYQSMKLQPIAELRSIALLADAVLAGSMLFFVILAALLGLKGWRLPRLAWCSLGLLALTASAVTAYPYLNSLPLVGLHTLKGILACLLIAACTAMKTSHKTSKSKHTLQKI